MKFVEFTDVSAGAPLYLNADLVVAVGKDDEGETVATCATGLVEYVRGTPSEVVAKLQGQPQEGFRGECTYCGTKWTANANLPCPNCPPVESEAVKLLAEVLAWNDATGDLAEYRSFPLIVADTRALLAKLKGGA